jgi:hypothetical protein
MVRARCFHTQQEIDFAMPHTHLEVGVLPATLQ